MLWMGGVLNDSIKQNDIVGSQIDIPATILGQFNQTAENFPYSKDLFNDGFGFITDSTKLIFDNVGQSLIYEEGKVDLDLKKGKAILQIISDDYINR